VTVFESIKDAFLSRTWTTPAGLLQARIVAILSSRAATHLKKLRWQSSIVDLMKLSGVDWRLDQRTRLASELVGCTGKMGNTAGLDAWLHTAVMRELALSLAESRSGTLNQNSKAQIRALR
jgi:hypothetical protein